MSAPSRPVLRVAVVGHTNTGKTSLLRTLTRDAAFGEVSSSPATTRHVEGTVLLVDGAPAVELYDTPGLEDSIGLLEHLDALERDRDTPWVDVVTRFLDGPAAHGPYEQEAKALRQVLSCDAALYVIDARDRVLGKHRDELEILGRCAKPVVPVLNFVASTEARTEEWRAHLGHVGMHVVAEFDTVVLNETAEQRLFEKMQTVLDAFRPTLETLIRERRQQRQRLVRAAAEVLADLLIDVAAYTVLVPAEGDRTAAIEALRAAVRTREQRSVTALLGLFRFRPDDYEGEALPIEGGHWGLDLFHPASLKQFGIRAGGGAAAGAVAGLAIDAMLGGASLGAGAALGATAGVLWSSLGSHGRRIAYSLRGVSELRVEDATVRLLAVRQLELVAALLRRGHASQDKIRLQARGDLHRRIWAREALPESLLDARVHPEWSRLGGGGDAGTNHDGARLAAEHRLADVINQSLTQASDPSGAPPGGDDG